MSAGKTDLNIATFIVNLDHYSVVIALDIEYYTIAGKNTCRSVSGGDYPQVLMPASSRAVRGDADGEQLRCG